MKRKRTSSKKPKEKRKKKKINLKGGEEEQPNTRESDIELATGFSYSGPSVSHVRNKEARSELVASIRKQKNIEKRKRRAARKRLKEEMGEDAPPMPQQRTLDNTREPDDTMVAPNDEEVVLDTAVDEFADYFANKTTPKILITTCLTWDPKGKVTRTFIRNLVRMFPNMKYRPRKNYKLPEIVEFCKSDNYTDILVINEDRRKPHSMILCHLPYGPTAYFRLTGIVRCCHINNRADPTEHFPELILNNFNTRLGHTVGRMFAALLPPRPEFEGRRVMTFHNQRDFIFFPSSQIYF